MFNGLDHDYRPTGRPEGDAMPPAYPQRVKAFVYGCGLFAEEEAVDRLKAMNGIRTTMRGGR